jgi:hypothetical protein
MTTETFAHLCDKEFERLIPIYKAEKGKELHPDIYVCVNLAFLSQLKRVEQIWVGEQTFTDVERGFTGCSLLKYCKRMRKREHALLRHRTLLLGTQEINRCYSWFAKRIKTWIESRFELSDAPKKAKSKGLPSIGKMTADQIRIHHYDMFKKMGKALELHLSGMTKEAIVDFLDIPKERYDQALTFYYGERRKRTPVQAKNMQ